ncbi:CRTAC1 family protein, partial [bacterium]|nr:CRTAC1 family protein [bacterium]
MVTGEAFVPSARAGLPPLPDCDNNSKISKTILFLNFEDGKGGVCSSPGIFSPIPLLMEIEGNTKGNRSKYVLHLKVREKEESGSVEYNFGKNGIEPVVITPDLHIAWCWNVSRVIGTNGFWIYMSLKDKRNDFIFTAGAVNYVKYMNDYMNIFHDSPLCWKYHSEPIYDYLWKRYGPFNNGDIVVESIGFGVSHGAGIEAWVDNIWLGEGEPPDSINVIEENESSLMKVESKITSFSYGFVNHDNIPDRIDVYRERADIFINPQMDKDRRFSPRGNIDYIKIEPDYVIDFKTQRGDGVVSFADLDADGHDDFLFHFDDLDGSLCYKNDYLRGEFSNVTNKIGALACGQEHGAGSAMADIDLDGDLDIFMFNAFTRHRFFGGVRLFRNEEGFSFVKWTEESRILSEGSFGGAFGDFDSDSDQDIFINYRPLDSGGRPFVSFNDGGGRFHPSEEALSAPGDIHFCSSTVADFDNDADLDIYCVSDWTAGSDEIPKNMFFANNGKGFFRNLTDSSKTGYPGRTNDALSGDFDQDGLVDIYLINSESPCVFYHNRGNNVFEESSAFKGFFCKIPVTNGTAVDIDRDGDLDIVLLRRDRTGLIIRKNRVDQNNFLQVKLRCEGKNRFGIGGRVYIYQSNYAGEKDYLLGFREIRSADGSSIFSPPVAHFGLGEHKNVDLLVIFPPIGSSPPDTVIKRNIVSGTFITVSERGGLWGSIFCNPRVDYLTSSFERMLFSPTSRGFFFLVFIIISGTGILIRNSTRGSLFKTANLSLILLILL